MTDEDPPKKVAPLKPPEPGSEMPIQKGLGEDTGDLRTLVPPEKQIRKVKSEEIK